MRKRIIIIIIAGFIALLGCVGFRTKAYAYTEEQKQQAKAWLSAHGYSPDAGGAAAAYQDYLNGKFDEELGITREETTGSSQAADETSGQGNEKDEKNEKTTEESTETPARINSVWDVMGANGADKVTDSEDTSLSEETTEVEASEEPATQLDSEKSEEVLEEAEAAEEAEEEKPDEDNVESTFFLKENMDKYKEAIMVVVLAVLGIAIIIGAVTLMKK